MCSVDGPGVLQSSSMISLISFIEQKRRYGKELYAVKVLILVAMLGRINTLDP